MFCPKCKSEYREGFYKCADCGVDLVAEQPPELMEEVSYVDLVEVYSTYQQSDIAFIKSVFDGEGITYYFEGESSIMLVCGGSLCPSAGEGRRGSAGKRDFARLGILGITTKFCSAGNYLRQNRIMLIPRP